MMSASALLFVLLAGHALAAPWLQQLEFCSLKHHAQLSFSASVNMKLHSTAPVGK